MIRKKAKKPSIKALKDKAWVQFSRYIRLKYSDQNGVCKCITCGKSMHWKEAQAGHGIPGRSAGILFLEEIVRPQCYRCNVPMRGMQEVFIPYLIDMYGRDGYESFMRLKHSAGKFTQETLEAMRDEFKRMADEYEAERG